MIFDSTDFDGLHLFCRAMPPLVKGVALSPIGGQNAQPNNRDIIWLQERATRKMR